MSSSLYTSFYSAPSEAQKESFGVVGTNNRASFKCCLISVLISYSLKNAPIILVKVMLHTETSLSKKKDVLST